MSATLTPSPSATDVRSDGDLVVAARAGDQGALLELLGRHEGSVAATCARWARRHEVADATQETFARAIDRLDDLRDPDAFGPWLRAIARNVARDACARDIRVIAVPDLHEDAACPAPGPDLAVCDADDARGLHERLAELSERDRRALWLRDAHGVSIPEVADELGLTVGSTRVMLARARRRLRESWAGVAGVFAGWRVELHQRFTQPVATTAPAWAAAIQVGAVAVALAIPVAGAAPVIVDDVPPTSPAVVSDAVPGANADSASSAERRGVAAPAPTAPQGDEAPTPPRAREPVATAGPVEVGGEQPDSQAVGAQLGSGDDAIVIEVFPGNLTEVGPAAPGGLLGGLLRSTVRTADALAPSGMLGGRG